MLWCWQFELGFAGPFKALPVVEHKGLSVNETGACAQYVAELLGYMSTDIGERARVVMVCDHIYEDVLINVAYCIWDMCEWDRDCLGGFAGPGSGAPMKFKVSRSRLQPHSTY